MDRLAISVLQRDISRHIALASEHRVGIEIQVYGYEPNLLDGDWQALVAQQNDLLRGFEGEIALHGAFYDMVSASPDERVNALARERYLQDLRVAAELGATNVVFHPNYCPLIRHPGYVPDWMQRQVAFWSELAEEARRLDLVIALENMWEPEPTIITGLLEQIGSPHLGACLDVGHVHLYSGSPLPVWLEELEEWLVHCHINNNPGLFDRHLPLDAEDGVIDYQVVLPMLRTLSSPPLVCLEMDTLEDLERSLHYLER